MQRLDTRRDTNEQVQNRLQNNRKTREKLQNHKKKSQHFQEQISIHDEIHTEEFSLFNFSLNATGQVQVLDSRKATNG